MATNPVEINVKTLTQQVNEGMKKKELAAHYGIPVTQMTKALQEAGLKIRRFRNAPAFTLVKEADDVTTDTVDTTTANSNGDLAEGTAPIQADTENDTTAPGPDAEVEWKQ